jgi:hypothetical protein
MENQIQREEKLIKEEKQLQDTHNDEYWAKKYDVSVDELREAGNIDISTLIIEAGIKHNAFSQ